MVALAQLANHLVNAKYLTRYVHISTPEVYGSCNNVSEDAPFNPSSPYAASKAAADLFLLTLFKKYKFPIVFVRSTNVYGAGQQLHKLIPKAIIYIKLGKKIPMHAKGRFIRSYIHIKDVAEGTYLAMTKGQSGLIYNLSPDKSMRIVSIVHLICNFMKVSFRNQVEFVSERAYQDYSYSIDSKRARKNLGWKPSISIEEGLRDVKEWIEKNWTSIQKLPHQYIHKP